MMRGWMFSMALMSPAMAMAETEVSIDALVEAEARFAADVAEIGLREGFLRHLIEESVVFRPLPVAAREWFERQEEPPFTLAWRPHYAEMAGSGDFGYTIGVWTSRPLSGVAPDSTEASASGEERDELDDEPETATASYGYYLTVWIRGIDGHWHPLADHGIGGLAEPAAAEFVQTLGGPRAPPIEGSFLFNTRYQGLMRAAMRLPSGQAAGSVERRWLADDLLLLRAGREPVTGHEAVRLVATGELGAAAPDLFVMAASGDLGMSLGGSPETGAYLRLWRHDGDADWQLAAEVATPVQVVSGDDADSLPGAGGGSERDEDVDAIPEAAAAR